jgi:hypothetical protein
MVWCSVKQKKVEGNFTFTFTFTFYLYLKDRVQWHAFANTVLIPWIFHKNRKLLDHLNSYIRNPVKLKLN